METTVNEEKTLNSKRSNFGPRGWLLFALCFGGYFTLFGLTGSLNIASQYYGTNYGWTNTSVMFATSIATWVIAVVAFATSGRLFKRSPRKLIFIFTLLFAACCFICPLSTTKVMFYIAFTAGYLCGFFWVMMLNPCLIANWFPRKTGLFMGWVTMGQALGPGVAAYVVRAMTNHLGFRISLLPYAIIAVILGVITISGVIKDFPSENGCYPDNDPSFDPEEVKKEEEEVRIMREKSPWTPKRVFTTKEFWFVWISVAFLAFCAGLQAQIIPTFISFGMNENAASNWTLIVAFVACGGSWLIGKLDILFGAKRAVIIGCLFVFAMVIIEQFGFLSCKIIAFVFVGVIIGGASNFLVSLSMRMWTPQSGMNVFKFMQPCYALVSGLSTTLISAVATAAGGNYNVSFLFIGLLGVVSLILILFVKRDNIAKKEEKFLVEDQAKATA